jgi:hypothetical protein
MFDFGIIETAPSKIHLASITWLAMQRSDGSRFVVVSQETTSDAGRYLASYEPGQAIHLPSIPPAITRALR